MLKKLAVTGVVTGSLLAQGIPQITGPDTQFVWPGTGAFDGVATGNFTGHTIEDVIVLRDGRPRLLVAPGLYDLQVDLPGWQASDEPVTDVAVVDRGFREIDHAVLTGPTGTWLWDGTTVSSVSSTPQSEVRVTDLNNDGRPDIVLRDGRTITFRAQDSLGSFPTAVTRTFADNILHATPLDAGSFAVLTTNVLHVVDANLLDRNTVPTAWPLTAGSVAHVTGGPVPLIAMAFESPQAPFDSVFTAFALGSPATFVLDIPRTGNPIYTVDLFDEGSDGVAFIGLDGSTYWWMRNLNGQFAFDATGAIQSPTSQTGAVVVQPFDYDADGDADVVLTSESLNSVLLRANQLHDNLDQGVRITSGVWEPIGPAEQPRLTFNVDVGIDFLSDATQLESIAWSVAGGLINPTPAWIGADPVSTPQTVSVELPDNGPYIVCIRGSSPTEVGRYTTFVAAVDETTIPASLRDGDGVSIASLITTNGINNENGCVEPIPVPLPAPINENPMGSDG